MDRRKGFDLYHTEIVIIRKEICPTSKFENIDQVTFKVTFGYIGESPENFKSKYAQV